MSEEHQGFFWWYINTNQSKSKSEFSLVMKTRKNELLPILV